MVEFTGERVIPGLVDDDLFNEHLGRYRFAARFAAGARVLDAGCGSGYGSVEFRNASSVIGTDISAEAVAHAQAHFARPGLNFLQASCEYFPFAAESFDLVTAFEVIEHLDRWRDLLTESHRVLKPTGVLLVSTPNKAYYAENRALAGPNPFHTHEFEFDEFQSALRDVFPHVTMWAQNRAEAMVFAPLDPTSYILDAGGDAAPASAHFFVAACSQSPIAANEIVAWLPSSGNLLRERERHIAKLEGELAEKDAWLKTQAADHASLQRSHEATLAELKQRNEWAAELNREIAERRAAIISLQDEAAVNLTWIRDLEARISEADAEIMRLSGVSESLEESLVARTAWARELESQLEIRTRHVQLQAAELAEHKAELKSQLELLDQRAELLGQYEATVQRLRTERRLTGASKWIRLGRRLNLGPAVPEEAAEE